MAEVPIAGEEHRDTGLVGGDSTEPRRFREQPAIGRVVQCGLPLPAQFAFVFLNRLIIDAGETTRHVAVFVKFPELVAVAAKPVSVSVVPFIFKFYLNFYNIN